MIRRNETSKGASDEMIEGTIGYISSFNMALTRFKKAKYNLRGSTEEGFIYYLEILYQNNFNISQGQNFPMSH